MSKRLLAIVTFITGCFFGGILVWDHYRTVDDVKIQSLLGKEQLLDAYSGIPADDYRRMESILNQQINQYKDQLCAQYTWMRHEGDQDSFRAVSTEKLSSLLVDGNQFMEMENGDLPSFYQKKLNQYNMVIDHEYHAVFLFRIDSAGYKIERTINVCDSEGVKDGVKNAEFGLPKRRK